MSLFLYSFIITILHHPSLKNTSHYYLSTVNSVGATVQSVVDLDALNVLLLVELYCPPVTSRLGRMSAGSAVVNIMLFNKLSQDKNSSLN